jgi:hypothetical protein
LYQAIKNTLCNWKHLIDMILRKMKNVLLLFFEYLFAYWQPPSDADHVRGFSSIGGAMSGTVP